jgi:hypothetical protein
MFAIVWAGVCGAAIATHPEQTWMVMAGACLGMNLTMVIVSWAREKTARAAKEPK